jgi:hypothetical protein
MASRVDLDLLLWAMRSALYRLIRMAIEMASEVADDDDVTRKTTGSLSAMPQRKEEEVAASSAAATAATARERVALFGLTSEEDGGGSNGPLAADFFADNRTRTISTSRDHTFG